MLTSVLQAIVNFFGSVGSSLVSALPDSPFQFSATNWPEWCNTIGAVIPVAGMVAHMTAFVSAVLVWYGLNWVLRFVKAIK